MNPRRPISVGIQLGSCATIAGVKPAPSSTPITMVMGGRTTAGAAIGARKSAATVHTIIGPSIQGRGSCRREKIQPPAAPSASAARKRR
jgi:hypothetical protein